MLPRSRVRTGSGWTRLILTLLDCCEVTIFMRVRVCVCVCGCMWMYVCACMWMYVCACMWEQSDLMIRNNAKDYSSIQSNKNMKKEEEQEKEEKKRRKKKKPSQQ